MSGTFTASYDGHCSECGVDIEAGDEAGYHDGDLVCEHCHVFLMDDDQDDWGMS